MGIPEGVVAKPKDYAFGKNGCAVELRSMRRPKEVQGLETQASLGIEVGPGCGADVPLDRRWTYRAHKNSTAGIRCFNLGRSQERVSPPPRPGYRQSYTPGLLLTKPVVRLRTRVHLVPVAAEREELEFVLKVAIPRPCHKLDVS
jgi:hypothetical protein